VLGYRLASITGYDILKMEELYILPPKYTFQIKLLHVGLCRNSRTTVHISVLRKKVIAGFAPESCYSA
jgi:hypothetical protein